MRHDDIKAWSVVGCDPDLLSIRSYEDEDPIGEVFLVCPIERATKAEREVATLNARAENTKMEWEAMKARAEKAERELDELRAWLVANSRITRHNSLK